MIDKHITSFYFAASGLNDAVSFYYKINKVKVKFTYKIRSPSSVIPMR